MHWQDPGVQGDTAARSSTFPISPSAQQQATSPYLLLLMKIWCHDMEGLHELQGGKQSPQSKSFQATAGTHRCPGPRGRFPSAGANFDMPKASPVDQEKMHPLHHPALSVIFALKSFKTPEAAAGLC